MSEELHKRIDAARAEVADIQKERTEILKWADSLGFPLYELPPANREELVKRYNKFQYLSSRLTIAQQDLSTLLLEAQAENSKNLNKITGNLRDSSTRLEFFSLLLVLVALLTLIGQFQIITDPTTRIFVSLAGATIVVIALILLSRIGR